jgi:putative endonuclease
MSEKRPCVYILASRRNGTLYVGMTTDLARRVYEHRTRAVPGFTNRYSVDRLVYVEFHDTIADAGLREKQLKHGSARGNSRSSNATIRSGAISMKSYRCSVCPWVRAFAGTTNYVSAANSNDYAPTSCRTSAAPWASAWSFAVAMWRSRGAMPQLVQGWMRWAGTNAIARRMVAATSSGVST